MYETTICTDGAVCASVDECASVRLIALLAMRNDILMVFGAEGWSKYGKKVNLHSIKTVNDCIR